MANIDAFKVEGFSELNRKLKTLDDKVKRREVLKIYRRLAKPVVKAYSAELPVGKRGVLSKSVKVDTVPARKSEGNPAIAVRPGKKGKNDSWYRFMVIPQGKKVGSRARGSRRGINTVVEEARNRAVKGQSAQLERKAVESTAAYIQKQINKIK